MAKSIVRYGAMIYVVLAGVVPSARAQSRIAGSLEQFSRVTALGSDITLFDHEGGEFSGFITALTPRELTMFVDGAPRVFGEREILRIHERRNDSVVNGALLGFAIGAGSAWAMTSIAKSANYYVDGAKATQGILGFGAGAAGIGILVDALRKSRSLIYHTSAARSVLIDYRVQMTRQRKSALLALRF